MTYNYYHWEERYADLDFIQEQDGQFILKL